MLAPTALAETVAVLDRQPTIGLVYTDYWVIDEQDAVKEYGMRCRVPYDKDRLLIEFMIFHFRLIRRSVYDQVGGTDERFLCCQDYDLCLKLSEVTEIEHLHQPLYYYRHHLHSIAGQQRYGQILWSKEATEQALKRRGLTDEYELEVQIFSQCSLLRKSPPSSQAAHEPQRGPSQELTKLATSMVAHVPKVSILLPTYNRKAVLDRALQSIFSQTYSDYKIIIIDDASSDGTADWLQTTYPDLQLIAFDHNQGASAARNAGIRAAQGEIIAFLDSDDQWHCQYLEKQVQALAGQPTAVLSYTQNYSAVEGNDALQPINSQPLDPSNLIVSMLLGNFIPSLSQVVMPQWALKTVGWFDERLQVCHDRDLYLRLFAIGSPTCVNTPLVTKFWQPESLVTRDRCQTWLADGLLLLDIFYQRPESRPYLALRSQAEG